MMDFKFGYFSKCYSHSDFPLHQQEFLCSEFSQHLCLTISHRSVDPTLGSFIQQLEHQLETCLEHRFLESTTDSLAGSSDQLRIDQQLKLITFLSPAPKCRDFNHVFLIFLKAEVILNHSYYLLHGALYVESARQISISDSYDCVTSCDMGRTGGSLDLN